MIKLNLQEDDKPVKTFRSWKDCALYIFDNRLLNYYISDAESGLILVKRRERSITLVPEHFPPVSILPML